MSKQPPLPRRLVTSNPIQPKNYTYKQAQIRSLELAPASARDWYNSNFVEAYAVRYYSVAQTGQECTCQVQPVETVMPSDHEVFSKTATKLETGTFVITKAAPPEPLYTELQGNEGTDVLSELGAPKQSLTGEFLDPNIDSFFDDPFGDGIDCAICQRLKIQPGYNMVNEQRAVLTTLNTTDMNKTEVSIEDRPHSFVAYSNGFVEWTIEVPKYYLSARFDVYNNHEVLDVPLMSRIGTSVVSLAAGLTASRGQTLVVRLVASQDVKFTHVSIEFQLLPQDDAMRVSLPQLQRMRDYTKFISIPTTQIVIDNRVQAAVHDVLYCDRLNLMWKITDVTPITLVNGYHVGWTLQGRIVQPLESSLLTMPTKRAI